MKINKNTNTFSNFRTYSSQKRPSNFSILDLKFVLGSNEIDSKDIHKINNKKILKNIKKFYYNNKLELREGRYLNLNLPNYIYNDKLKDYILNRLGASHVKYKNNIRHSKYHSGRDFLASIGLAGLVTSLPFITAVQANTTKEFLANKKLKRSLLALPIVTFIISNWAFKVAPRIEYNKRQKDPNEKIGSSSYFKEIPRELWKDIKNVARAMFVGEKRRKRNNGNTTYS